MGIKITTHRGYDIEFFLGSDQFGCPELQIRNNGLGAVKDKIDAHIRAERGAPRVPALVSDWTGTFAACEITSVFTEMRGGEEMAFAWVARPKGGREKVKLDNLHPDDAATRAAIVELTQLMMVAERAREAVDAHRKGMTRITMDYIAKAREEAAKPKRRSTT